MPPDISLVSLPGGGGHYDSTDDLFDVEHDSSLYDEATTLNQAPHTTHSPHVFDYSYTLASAQVGAGEAQEAAAASAGMNAFTDDALLADDAPPSEPGQSPVYSAPGPAPASALSTPNHPHPPFPHHNTNTSSLNVDSPLLPSTFSYFSLPSDSIPIFPIHQADFPPTAVDLPFGGLDPGPEGLDPSYPPASLHLDTAISEVLTPGILPPQNPNLLRFLDLWARSRPPEATGPSAAFPRPSYSGIQSLVKDNIRSVGRHDLRGDEADIQGIDWSSLHIKRNEARRYRLHTYQNFVNVPGSDVPGYPHRMLPRSESYFRFHSMHLRKRNIRLNHFQLRHILASAGRNRSFYPDSRGVRQINPLSGKDQNVIDLRDMESGGIVSTLAASSRVLVAGTFNGEYCIKNLDSSTTGHHTGQITDDDSGITTHVQVYGSRASGAPTAAFASNDRVFRTLDVETETFTMQARYNFAVNCATLSPDKRLRLMVGDSATAVVADAETGEVLRELGGHRDYGFACDWSDDGWTVATGSQDMTVKVWDARRWCDSRGRGTPVATLRSEMAGVRTLRFSPAGGGERVLVAAEEADFVNVIDATTFARKQTFDVFGEIGGVDFCDGGRELQVLCCDWMRGGLMRFERCGWGGREDHAEMAGAYEGLQSPKRGWEGPEGRARKRRGVEREVFHLEQF
ncbi:uncharacterized protein DNG_00441 [Cephalotrichum gorgonifer]|uniref:WD40 domain-containing protein n=1 Tax=Cephalotrichum gorgonifer TaxID=2041049 RepID=A0AAE8MPE5_9PEZI|nr:uncharacterized protein DNG_00441 [Cephalotrichum gorgonifer]